MPMSGLRRFFSTSTARARSGERYTRRVRRTPSSGGGVLASRSRPQRKAASVLPEPVGASTSVWAPAAMAGQPWRWAGVGSGNDVSNQARTAGEKASSAGSAGTRSTLPVGV